jgi:hypothetical protein
MTHLQTSQYDLTTTNNMTNNYIIEEMENTYYPDLIKSNNDARQTKFEKDKIEFNQQLHYNSQYLFDNHGYSHKKGLADMMYTFDKLNKTNESKEKACGVDNMFPNLKYNTMLESDMKQGLPTRLAVQKKKSNGFSNSFENNFFYVSSDIQKHPLFTTRAGANTRQDNKINDRK